MKAKDITSELARMWGLLNDEDKVPYVKEAEADKVRFQHAMEEYTAASNVVSTPEVKGEVKEEVKEEKKAAASRKKKQTNVKQTTTGAATQRQPKSGYLLFCRETRDDVQSDHPEWSKNQVSKELKLIWAEMDDDEKNDYNERV